MAQPLQIIVTGETADNCFNLREENLASIIAKVPADTKVAIVSVVGAFRTGKSFLLNFFLRYLRSEMTDDLTQSWMVSEGDELAEGNMNEGWNLVESEVARHENSFAWRGGQERQTTGIWMWSEPFIRTTTASGEKLAVLLMDTQGMFDNETTMTLTAQIFGLSTLVSSFQIYNVDKRIQEDNLQHLALFSEYGRMALAPQQEGGKDSEYHVPSPRPASDIIEEASVDTGDITLDVSSEETGSTEVSEKVATTPVVKPAVVPAVQTCAENKSPFQRLQFLVRDWQNFDTEYDENDAEKTYGLLCGEMEAYLKEVLRSRDQGDLQSTREQITRCFETLDCFMLPHPGFAVTHKKYDGSISKIEPFFRAMINKYVRFIFDEQLEAKVINNRKLTGLELKTYFEVYVKMFQAGEKNFPKAMTMLDATAEANNRNAFDLSLAHYKTHMEKLVGPEKVFIKETELVVHNEALVSGAFIIFDDIATMGSVSVIAKMRETLNDTIEAERVRYFTTNALRNPFRDVELFILPMAIAAIAWFIAVTVNASCSTDFCEHTEHTFRNVYGFIFFMTIVFLWKQIRGIFLYLKEILPVILAQNVAK